MCVHPTKATGSAATSHCSHLPSGATGVPFHTYCTTFLSPPTWMSNLVVSFGSCSLLPLDQSAMNRLFIGICLSLLLFSACSAQPSHTPQASSAPGHSGCLPVCRRGQTCCSGS